METKRKFPEEILTSIRRHKMLRIRAGDGLHRFIGIWAVVVEDRVFVRSWSLKPKGWYRTFLEEPRDAIFVGGREIPIRVLRTRSERLMDAIDEAYLTKYNTRGSLKYARDLGRAKSRRRPPSWCREDDLRTRPAFVISIRRAAPRPARQKSELTARARLMTEQDGWIDCPEHGSSPAAFVCQHLLSGQGLGFHIGPDPDAPDALWPDAWCDACEEVLTNEGEWNEAAVAFADIRLLCANCYQKVRLLNWPREHIAATAKLLDSSIPYLQARQRELETHFRLGTYPRYDWDQESAELVFSDRGTPKVIANIQFVGSVSTRSRSWLWSWANPSLLEPAKSKIRMVREYGDRHSLLKLACAYWSADEEDGWEMTAVSAYLLKAKGVYRSPDERGFTFLIMTDVRWAE
jgi:hypothetical protein